MKNPGALASENKRRFAELLYQRATGQAPEMECAKALCALLRELYTPGMRILDAGCGAGHYLRSLRQRLDPQIDYFGLDINAEFIRLATKAFSEETRFSVGSIVDMPFVDAEFDIVFCANVLPNLPPPTHAIAEMLRVARRHVVIRTMFSDRNHFIRELDALGTADRTLISPDGEFDIKHVTYNNMYTEDYLRGIVHDIDPALGVAITPDNHWQIFDNREHIGSWGTNGMDDRQISGQLILDWRFITLSKA